MTDKKALHVGLCGPLPPPHGGMANQFNQLRQLLTNEAVRVSVLQTNAPYRYKIIENVKGIRAVFRMVPYLFNAWKFAGEVDVIHVFSNSWWSWQLFSAPVLWLAWLRKTPVIINYRGGEARDYFNKSIKWVRPSINKAAAVIVPSGYLKTVFSDFEIEARVIPNIVNLERFHPRDNYGRINARSPRLIITRNLEAIYGISTAIRAVALLRQTVPGIQLSIAGSGPQREDLQQWVKQEGLEKNIRFTGKLTPEEIAELYQRADIMLNPATADNMPNSVLEAMASGVAVVTSDVGGIPYLLENNKTALFTEVNNPEAMAKQIGRLLDEPALYEALVNNGLQEVRQYTWERIGILWLALYRSLTVNS
jgi:glycosyltransferase involved in cell wall biosynthesis